ncbi:hypothetical protein IPL68_07520 [Candidatus Saccharibacteria bacterium]|nr:MAG: hypothetical protein IPL68_07520 [Candidatus Saccharibacteria bacterium]
MNRKLNRTDAFQKHREFLIPKIVSLFIIAGLVVALTATQQASGMPSGIDKIYTETAANWALLVSGASALILGGYYGGKYSILWAKAVEIRLDEREKSVRNRVFLRAYRWMVALMFFGLLGLMQSTNGHMQTVSGWVFLVLAISLPSIIASWTRASR